MEALTTGISSLFTVMGTAFTQALSNEYIVLFMAASVIGVAIGVFRGLRSM